jgi:hypothetical protein
MTADVSQYNSGAPGGVFDADAVCAVCGTVNTDGTLLCRGCGNNLRDQKLRRLQAEVPGDIEGGLNTRMIVRGIGGVLGLLLVLFVALNVERIADTLAGGGSGPDPAARFFSGNEGATYDLLLEQARLVPATPDTVERALATLTTEGTLDGAYVIVSTDYYEVPEVLGTAIVATEGDLIRFVALMSNGYEMRGLGYSQGAKAFRADWENMAVKTTEGVAVSASGVAVRQTDGGLDCFGQSGLDEFSYGAVAYRIP